MAERRGGVDFFISYTGADRAWAEWIAWQLEAASHSTVLQAWDFRPGENFVVQMRRALDTAERTLAVVSAAYLESVYGSDEWTAAFTHDRPDTTSLVMVRVEEVPLSRLLRPWIYIDLVALDQEAAVAALLAGVERGRRKPTQPPAFPPATQPAGAPRFPRHGVANLPPRNPNFTGRQQLLGQLARNLRIDSVAAVVGQPPGGQPPPGGAPTAPQALAGMGGVGKTQLALEYAHRHATDYEIRWWIPSEQPLAIPVALAALARRLGIAEQADQEETVAQVLGELGRRDRWLLVFDNAVDPKQLAGYQPSGGGGHVVVTTRSRAFGGVATPIDVGVFDRDEATEFLQQRTGSSDRQVAQALAEELGGLPLALEQAAAFADQTGLGLGEYLQLYRQDREVLLEKGDPVAYGTTVDATFRLAITKVSGRSEAAVELLQLCGFLAPEVIPHYLLTAKPDVLPAALGQVVQNEVAYDETVGVLRGFSLVEREQAGLRVHRLVQAVTRHRLDPEERAAWAARAVQLTWNAWPDDSLLPAAWPRCARLLPHALVSIDHAKRRQVPPEARADLMIGVGRYLWRRAELQQAQLLLEEAVSICEAHLGPNHPTTALSLNSLGEVLHDQDRLDAARSLHERALQIREARLGADHPDTARSLNLLARVLRDQGDLAGARSLHERALAVREAHLGPNHPITARSMSNLASVLHAQGDRHGARSHLERALSIYGDRTDFDDDKARSLDLLGRVLRDQGELEGARTHLERALAIREAHLGPDHPDTAWTLNNLGEVLHDQGDLAVARRLYERALAIREARLGPDHPTTAWSLKNLGTVLRDQGELEGARTHLERALRIYEARRGGDNPYTREAREGLAAVDAALANRQ